MKRKLRIFSNIAIICLSVCMFAFGVYAASNVSVTTSGTVSFTATGVYAKVSGVITECAEVTAGNTSGLAMEDITLGSSGVISGNVSTWANKEISFNSDNVATISVTVTNLADDRPMYVTVYDKTTDNKINTTMKLGTEDILAATVTKVNASASVTFTIQMSPADLNTSFEADYQYLIDLDATDLDEDTIKEKLIVETNNSSLGTVEKSFNGNEVTLTASPTSGNQFLGYVIGNPNNGHFVFVNSNEVGTNTLTETINLKLLDNRAIYGVFYSDRVLNYIEETNTASIVYIGTNYASVTGGDISINNGLDSVSALISSADQIVEKVEYNGKEYNVALLESSSGIDGLMNAGYSIFGSTSEIILPENISGFKDYFSYYSATCTPDAESNTIMVYSKNFYYCGDTAVSKAGSYINNQYMISTIGSYEQLYWAGELRNIYISNSITFDEIHPCFSIIIPTSNTQTKNGVTYTSYTDSTSNNQKTVTINDCVYALFDSGFAVFMGGTEYVATLNIPETIIYNEKTYVVKGINAFKSGPSNFDTNVINIPKSVKYIYVFGYVIGSHDTDIIINIPKSLKGILGTDISGFLEFKATINFEGTEAEWDAIKNSAKVELHENVTKVNFNVSMD